MNRKFNAVFAAAAVSTMSVQYANAAYLTVYGGLTYNSDPSVLTGYTNASMQIFGVNAADGIGIASATYYNGGAYSGSVAERFNTSGATLLGNLGTSSSGSTSMAASSINATGTAVGYAEKYSGSTDLGPRAVRWDPSSTTPVVLQTLGTSTTGVGRAVAYYVGPDGSAAGFSSKYNSSGGLIGDRAVRWDSSGNITELGTIGFPDTNSGFGGYPSTYVDAMNSAGIAVGIMATPSSGARPVRWDTTGTALALSNLGTQNGTPTGVTYGTAAAIDSAGQIVGSLHKYDASGNDLDSRAVTWNASGGVTELGNLGTYTTGSVTGKVTSYAYAINSSGVSVGNASVTSSSDTRAVRWAPDGTVTALGTLYPTVSTNSAVAYSINDAGIAVGGAGAVSGTFGNHAVMWGTNGVAIDLNSFIDPASGWTLQNAYSITDTDWVSGIGLYDPDGAGPLPGYGRAFLIQVPVAVPEPASLSVLALGGMTLLGRRRSRNS
jgi:hypothetical protein